MIRIRFSKRCGVEVEGSGEELRGIRDSILAIVHAGDGSWELVGPNSGSPAPYDSWLTRLVVAIGTGPACATVTADTEVRVTGDPESLGAFASFFDPPENAEAGWHSHHEHYPGNRWVAVNSQPVVVALRSSTGE